MTSGHGMKRICSLAAMMGAIVVTGCTEQAAETGVERHRVELQGHRGARGLLPENTIPGFIRAMELGAETLELDVVVSKDGVVVVSHEPWPSAAICSTPDGQAVSEEEQRSLNLYQMSYAEIAAFDCGSRGHASFPNQMAMETPKPRLADVFDEVDAHAAEVSVAQPNYNVEIKSSPEGDDVYHPAPAEYVRLVRDVLVDNQMLARATVQSFDPRVLEAMHALDPSIPLAFLVGNEDGLEANLARLTFMPDIYSPNHALVNPEMLEHLHEMDMRVIPWTVNEEDDMRALIALGVDGLITDYPGLGRRIIDELSTEETP